MHKARRHTYRSAEGNGFELDKRYSDLSMILKHTQPYSHVFKGVTIDGLWVGEWIH
jgi:hypothetical protein